MKNLKEKSLLNGVEDQDVLENNLIDCLVKWSSNNFPQKFFRDFVNSLISKILILNISEILSIEIQTMKQKPNQSLLYSKLFKPIINLTISCYFDSSF